ncbi:TIGR02302 family protein [Roseibium sediminis]|uniref:TIGR02302 family protein n=1 Tax=Roseibium sediminis TaxID=1775174 RepID=UPI00123C8B73|nr:TIGR02302 family protein [Roseibium sediminis]
MTRKPDTYQTQTGAGSLIRRLNRIIGQSRLALFVEKLWRALFPGTVVLCFFVGLSWIGFWDLVSPWIRIPVLAGLALTFLWSLGALRHLSWPSREEALARIETESGVDHRPLTSFEDDLSLGGHDPASRALWTLHKKRLEDQLAKMRAHAPNPQAYRLDPYALRTVAVMLAVTGYFVAGDQHWQRLGAAFQNPFVADDVPTRMDAWVTPPLYTGEPPLYLTGESAALRKPGVPLSVPEGSIVTVRAQGMKDLGVEFADQSTGKREPVKPDDVDGETTGEHLPFEVEYKLQASGSIDLVRDTRVIQQFAFVVRPDDAPEIRLTDDPEEQLSGALKFSYLVKDDYGVVSAEAHIAPAPETLRSGKTPRPLVEAPQFPLSLPPVAGTAKTGETIRDLTSHPWAGLEVDLLLTARDEAAQEGTSPAYRITLPQRLFRKSLARAIVEQRRDLALDANNHLQVITAFDALMLAPEAFGLELRVYLGMDYAYRQIISADNDDELKELLPVLWDLALTIEDGDLSVAERALRDAQEALRKALENGASDEEIARLTQELRDALNNYMQALAEQMQRNPQAMQPFNSSQQQTMSQQDLSDMLDKIEELAKTGSRDAARELLAQMQQMLENLQAGRPQMMPPDGKTGEMMEMLNELSEMIQKQQQLMDQTHQFNQRQSPDGQQQGQNQPGQQNQQQQGQGQQMTAEQLQKMLDQLKQGQGNLAQQLQELMEQLGQNGMGENQALGEAGKSMGEAQQSLGEGQGEQALGQQGNALESLRQGAQGLAEQMMGQGNGPGMAEGPAPRDEDPLGRPRRTEGPDFGNRVKVPDEIDVQRARRILEELRRRFSDPSRPQIELDYLERLLKRY